VVILVFKILFKFVHFLGNLESVQSSKGNKALLDKCKYLKAQLEAGLINLAK
jgi:hypothetical protein